MPEVSRHQRGSGAHSVRGPVPLPPAWQELADRVIPAPDQARYGPPGTTDSPRYTTDGRRLPPRETKGDTET